MEGLIAKTGELTLSFLTNLSLTVDLMVEVRLSCIQRDRNVKRRILYFLLNFLIVFFFQEVLIIFYKFSG